MLMTTPEENSPILRGIWRHRSVHLPVDWYPVDSGTDNPVWREMLQSNITAR